MTPGTRVRTPDGRTGQVVERSAIRGSVWVEVDQVSNVNRVECFKAEFLEVIRVLNVNRCELFKAEFLEVM